MTRKPDRKIYKLAVDMLDVFARKNVNYRGRGDWAEGVKPNEMHRLELLGENLKAAKWASFGTVKVNLEEAYKAVDKLEKLMGLKSAGEHPRISSAPKRKKKRKTTRTAMS